MAEKYENQEHQKPVGKMSEEEIEIFLDKGYTPCSCQDNRSEPTPPAVQ